MNELKNEIVEGILIFDNWLEDLQKEHYTGMEFPSITLISKLIDILKE